MADPKSVRAPTTASLPNNLRIPSTTPSLTKTLGRLSRTALIELALYWLDDRNVTSFPPYLQPEDEANNDDEETLPYPAAETIAEVRIEYENFQERKGGKREVLERILEGDWRHGITLRQLAMADLRYMDDHPAGLRWTAMEISRIDMKAKKATDTQTEDWSSNIPRMQAATFVRALQHEIAPLVKAHYHLSRSLKFPLTFLRIFIVDSPYQTPRQTPEIFADATRIIYVAFPDSCPFLYTSITTAPAAKTGSTGSIANDPRTLQRLVRDAIPKALSRPQERYTLNPTALTAKNLPTLLALRGPGRTTAANGAFSIFADAALEGSPLDPRPSNTVSAEEHMRNGHEASAPLAEEDKENISNEPQKPGRPSKKRQLGSKPDTIKLSPNSKKRRLVAASRFGTTGSSTTPAPLDRLDIRLLDNAASTNDGDADSAPTSAAVSLTFTGSDVIGGIRRLAELGVVDPERIPSWMTGEEAASMMFVRGGRRLRSEV
ncbi:hypothetical protein N7532_007546 [Penicillium argentinense]|uniref:CHL4 family chromosome segregation protein n=1 Tax=Penicillium argentinense TaxID=1131581 RepID=A0A9W9F7W6_9EURO|nr:uncharacterized protein N7532_007546 [Penicillium argentinense]KAJ5095255.1 hypothetical protein N7532_007546 [Penicillium argentinense]